MRMTTSAFWPQRQWILAKLLTIWLNPQVTKSLNCISIMAFLPAMDSPRAAPTMADSQSGVLRTRSSPKASTKPSVTLNTPP